MNALWHNISLSEHIQPLQAKGYRVVESQQGSSTFALVDSNDEHELLEAMIEANKPPKPVDCTVQDYLLFTPFRYPPLLAGTRFGKQTERSPFYGAFELQTALQEIAYKRLQFLQDTTAILENITVSYTSFCFHTEKAQGLDLRTPSFNGYATLLRHPSDYTETQHLGSIMRTVGIALCFYHSTRHKGGSNICIFTPQIFAKPSDTHHHWRCVVLQDSVTFIDDTRKSYVFER